MLKETDFPPDLWFSLGQGLPSKILNPATAAAVLVGAFLRDKRALAVLNRYFSRLAELHALDSGSAEVLGRIAFHENDADNPFWERGLYEDEQLLTALEWRDGWLDEERKWSETNASIA